VLATVAKRCVISQEAHLLQQALRHVAAELVLCKRQYRVFFARLVSLYKETMNSCHFVHGKREALIILCEPTCCSRRCVMSSLSSMLSSTRPQQPHAPSSATPHSAPPRQVTHAHSEERYARLHTHTATLHSAPPRR
jgi:hypothetical protein